MGINVIIDAGHGYNTPGKCSAPFKRTVTHKFQGKTVTVNKGEQFKEHVANVGVAYYLEEELKKYGIGVIRSGWDDPNAKDDVCPVNPSADVVKRQKELRTKDALISVSCHFNAYGDGKTFNTGQGISVLCHSVTSKVGDGKELAEAVYKRLANTYPEQKERGIAYGPGWGMCNATALDVKAAILCEYAFMTNEYEAENYFCNPEAWHKYAVSTSLGIIDYLTGGNPVFNITKSSSEENALWLQMMLNKWIAKGFIEHDLLKLDGKYGNRTAECYRAFARYKKWETCTGWYVGSNGIRALLR